MDEGAQQQFQIYLPGLLKVLAENLYSSKKVALRELLQNAHDSCIRRAVEGDDPAYHPRIDISIDPSRRVLTIRDNGSGLTADEVTQYLSTIGRSFTRELGEKLSILSPDEAAKLIGQFGLGFLSAFLVAAEVTFTTRSLKEGSPALRWYSTGDVHYDLSPAVREEVGSTVELLIKSGASFLLNLEILIEAIRQYADFLPIPIYVGNEPQPVNLMAPPWEAAHPQMAIAEYIARVFKSADPLCILPLVDHVIDLGHDTLVIPFKGFLFVPSSSTVSVREYGDVSVYIRRMFICDRQRDLLPPWARFVRGVIDCPYLQPTASREEIQRDDNFIYVQQALESQLAAGLKQIAQSDPNTWKKIVRGHSDLITGWAVQDNEFFEQVADLVVFRTSRGLLNLPDYLQLTEQTIYYVTRELGSLQEQLLGEGQGVPVVEAVWFAVTPFLKKYAQVRQGIRLVQLDGESNQFFRPVSEVPFLPLLAYYRERGVKAHAAAISPEDVPALMIYPKDAEFLMEARNALDTGAMADPLAGFVGEYMKKIASANDDITGTLYLNAACSLIRRLSDNPPPDDTRNAVLELIYQVARLFGGRMLTPADAAKAFRGLCGAIEGLV
jgi:molecular chaperone HtpG